MLEEYHHREAFSVKTNGKKLWIFHEVFLSFLNFLFVCSSLILEIKSGKPHDWHRGHGDIIELIDELIVESLSTECRVES